MKRSFLVILISLTSVGSALGQDFLQFTYQPFGYGKLNSETLDRQGFYRVLELVNADTIGNGFVVFDLYFIRSQDFVDTLQLLGIALQQLVFEHEGKRTIYSPYWSQLNIGLSKQLLNEFVTRSKKTSFIFSEKGEAPIIKVTLALKFEVKE